MGPTEINLYGIAHVKVDFILLQKMYVIPRVGRFVWTISFAQCDNNLVTMALSLAEPEHIALSAPAKCET